MYSLKQFIVLAATISSVVALRTAKGGALDPLHRQQQPEPEKIQAHPVKPVKLKVTNKVGKTLQAVVVTSAGDPSIGKSGPVGSTWETLIPVRSAGHITLGTDTNDRGSKIEVSNQGPPSNDTRVFVNLSLVDGYSLPIVCRCAGSGVKTGCNKDLFKLGSCPSGQSQGPVCLNKSPDNGPPQSFFAPCRNDAYTFPNQPPPGTGTFCDDDKYEIDCCVGNGC